MTDEIMQDYIDGRLDDRERAGMDRHLRGNPRDAALAADLQRQNELLRNLGGHVLEEPVPERLRSIVRNAAAQMSASPAADAGIYAPAAGARRRFYMPGAIAASLVALMIGGLGGWYARDYTLPPPVSMDDIILSSGLDAYRLYGGNDYMNPVEFSSDRIADLTGWLDKTFKAKIIPPSLEAQGYTLVGGRVLPYSNGNYGFFLFENNDKSRIAVICWPHGEGGKTRQASKYNPGKDYASSSWNNDKFGFAVYGQSKNAEFQAISDAVMGFYDKLFKKN